MLRFAATLAASVLFAAPAPEPLKEPRVLSAHPIAGQRGVPFTIAVRGESLRDATAVFTDGQFSAAIERADTETSGKKPADVLYLRVQTDDRTALGSHPIRLVTPRGISNAISIYVTDAPVTPESADVLADPQVRYISGRIAQKGEVDQFAFEAKAGEVMTFETVSGLPAPGAAGGNANGFDPSVSLYEPSGSWFDPTRLNRLAFNDEPLWVLGQPTDARMVYRFARTGQYFLKVEAFSGQGGPDYSYLLKVSRGPASDDPPRRVGKGGWEERTFTRALSPDRLTQLAERGKAQKFPAIETYGPDTEVKLPAAIEGKIAVPGESHRSRFRIDGPKDIAIEVQATNIAPPEFNPIVRLLKDGEEVATNIFAGRGACTGALNKSLQSKVVIPLRDPGEYTLEVRETTADLGDPGFQYRVMIRQQVPHLGQIKIDDDRVNLKPGEAKAIRVTFDREEDYRGAVMVGAEGLPPGVTAMAGADYEPDKDPPASTGKRERYTPRTERAVIVFTAASDAATTPMPITAMLKVRPLVDGKPGAVIHTRKFPLMILEGQK